MISWFSIILYGVKRKRGNVGNEQKAFQIRKKKTVLAVIITRQLPKKNEVVILSTILSTIFEVQ